jgi:hypothetical protein
MQAGDLRLDAPQDQKGKDYVSFGLRVLAPDSPVAIQQQTYQPLRTSASAPPSQAYVIDAPIDILADREELAYANPGRTSCEVPSSSVSDQWHNNQVPPLQRDIMQDTFAEMVNDAPNERAVPLVVLDCANIGWNFAVNAFDARGVELAISYFHRQNIDVVAFIPASYLRAKPRQIHGAVQPVRGNAMMLTEEVEMLTSLVQQKLLTTVPSGDSDDAYILNYARDNNGFVISNDLFHDHLNSLEVEGVRRSMRVWLQEHRCGYTFTNKSEFVFNPSSELRALVYRHLKGVMESQYAAKYRTEVNSVNIPEDCAGAALDVLHLETHPGTGHTQSEQNSQHRAPPATSIYSVTEGNGMHFMFYDLTSDPPAVLDGTVLPGALGAAIHAVTAAINQLSVLPGCPVPPYGHMLDAVRVGIPAVGDGRVAGLTEADSLAQELAGLFMVRAGLLEKVSGLPTL